MLDFDRLLDEKDRPMEWKHCEECECNSCCGTRIHIVGESDPDFHEPYFRERFEEFLKDSCPFFERTLLYLYAEKYHEDTKV